MRFEPRKTTTTTVSRAERFQAGFTLVEVLASLLFMAIVIPVTLEGLRIASRAGEVAARKGEAALVAERLLNESLVTTNWNKSVQGGTLVDGAREFRWTLNNVPWNQDPNQNVLRQLTVQIRFTAQGQDYFVRLSTLADTSLPLESQTTSSQ
jgi:type II secretory pathway pseudopilin PulG